MSMLLDLLNKKKDDGLQPTETFVTTTTGKRFVEKDGVRRQSFDFSHGFVIDTHPDSIPAKVTDHIWIGSQDAAMNKEFLQEKGVTHVLNVATGIDNFHPNDFKYMDIEVLDIPEEDIHDHFNEANQFIEGACKAKSGILVHCNAGVSRSASFICAYLMKTEKIGFDDALARVKKERKQAKPNKGFVDQLRRYEQELKKTT